MSHVVIADENQADTFEGAGSDLTARASRLTIRWALKRALLGIAILVFFIGGTAWLMHATIDTSAEAGVDAVQPVTTATGSMSAR